MKMYLITDEFRLPLATGIPETLRFRVAQEWANELEALVYMYEQPGDTLVAIGPQGAAELPDVEEERILPRVD